MNYKRSCTPAYNPCYQLAHNLLLIPYELPVRRTRRRPSTIPCSSCHKAVTCSCTWDPDGTIVPCTDSAAYGITRKELGNTGLCYCFRELVGLRDTNRDVLHIDVAVHEQK